MARALAARIPVDRMLGPSHPPPVPNDYSTRQRSASDQNSSRAGWAVRCASSPSAASLPLLHPPFSWTRPAALAYARPAPTGEVLFLRGGIRYHDGCKRRNGGKLLYSTQY
eukprot:scaffold84004_cov33-Tisochrysis_lutea.AAC.1